MDVSSSFAVLYQQFICLIHTKNVIDILKMPKIDNSNTVIPVLHQQLIRFLLEFTEMAIPVS